MITSAGFDETGKLGSDIFVSMGYWRKNGSTVHQLFADFKKAYDLVTREVLYNILIVCVVSMKVVRLVKMRLIEILNKFIHADVSVESFLSQMA
jgi:hypothetical protein